MTFDAAGNLYGTTQYGGPPNRSASVGYGTLFKLTPGSDGNWSESILHFFGTRPGDGTFPGSAVLVDASGNLFGTTASGPGGISGGTVFEIAP